MYQALRLVLSSLCLLAACGEHEDRTAKAAAAADIDIHPGLILLPAGPRAPVDHPTRLTLHRGGSILGSAASHIADTFDPCFLRVGGEQHNVLQADVVDGRAGITVRPPRPGHAMAGFSTMPRRVRWHGATVRFSQHVKSLFIAAVTPGDIPRSSAAMSFRAGLRLEIVPMLDPLPLLPGEDLPLQVRFDGPELGGVELVLHCQSDAAPEEVVEVCRRRTDDAGTVVVPIRKPGRYLATVTKVLPGTEPEVLWAALTFYIGEAR